MAVHDLLKGREHNRNKAMEGFDKVNDPRIARAVHQGGYADVLLRPTMVGILRCGKMLPPQLNLVIEIEFADATTALWSENAGAHPSGATLSTDFEIQNVRVLASQVVLDSALVESFNRVLLSGRSLVFSYPTVHTQQSSVPNGVCCACGGARRGGRRLSATPRCYQFSFFWTFACFVDPADQTSSALACPEDNGDAAHSAPKCSFATPFGCTVKYILAVLQAPSSPAKLPYNGS